MGRSSIRLMLSDTTPPDYRYYKEKGWFESECYYPTRLGLMKKAAGSLFDTMGRRRATRRES